jgi:hypothetical protein
MMGPWSLLSSVRRDSTVSGVCILSPDTARTSLHYTHTRKKNSVKPKTTPTTTITLTPKKTRSKKRQTLARSRLSILSFLCHSSNADLAKRIGVSPTLLSSISTLKVVPSDELLTKIGAWYQVDPARLQYLISPGKLFQALQTL